MKMASPILHPLSPIHMFRNLEARTDNGELLNLMDSTGCPLNELIFPALALESTSRALYANFKVLGVPA